MDSNSLLQTRWGFSIYRCSSGLRTGQCGPRGSVGPDHLLSMAPQFVDSLQIPGHTDKIPFPVNGFDPSERKLSKSKHRFDDPKNRFWRTLALGINSATRRRLHPVFHLTPILWASWPGGSGLAQTYLEFHRVTFSLHRNVGKSFSPLQRLSVVDSLKYRLSAKNS